jgi:hypothetical protein
MVATPGAEELQLTELVRFCCVPSLKVPVAVKDWFVPETIVGAAGLTAMDESVADFTVMRVDPLTEPAVAVIVAWPAPTQATCPLEATVATVDEEVVQFTDVVRFCWLLSLNVPVAVTGCTTPTSSEGFCGFT